jgi:hypothetical protein
MCPHNFRALQIVDYKENWLNAALLVRNLAEAATVHLHMLDALQQTIGERWRKTCWQWLFQCALSLAYIAIAGKTREIRLRAIGGCRAVLPAPMHSNAGFRDKMPLPRDSAPYVVTRRVGLEDLSNIRGFDRNSDWRVRCASYHS